MRILWVIPSPIGKTKQVLFNEKNEKSVSGQWIDYSLESLTKNNTTVEFAVMTTSKLKNPKKKTEDNITYYCINAGKAHVGQRFPQKYEKKVLDVVEDFNPDIIQFWGTETGFGLLVLDAVKDKVPVVGVLQGIMSAISKYDNGGLKWKELALLSPVDFLKYPFLNRIDKLYKKQAIIEKEILKKSKQIISESDWAYSFAKRSNRNINCYFFPLQINKLFYDFNWDLDKIEKHSIFSISGRGSHKGIHNLIKAAGILKDKYPDLIVYLPGNDLFKMNKIRDYIYRTPYTSYLLKLITELGLENHVKFTGVLTPIEMAEIMQRRNCFVMPSIIENQSASLREAQIMGLPVVTSYVGCIEETVIHKNTGMIYRYEEYEVLANYISMIFDNDQFAKKIGDNSKRFLKELYYNQNGGEIFMDIYNDILDKFKNS